MFGRIIPLLLQLSVVVAAVLLSTKLTASIWLVPRQLRKQSPFGVSEVLTILGFLIGFSLIILVVTALINKRIPFSSLRRSLADYYGAMVATSLAASTIFLFTVIPFSANFFAWVFVLITVGYLILTAIFLGLSQRSEEGDKPVIGLLFSGWTIITFLLVVSPVALAVLYKKNTTAYNAINSIRATFNSPKATTWALQPAFPGQVFEQPMMMAFEPGQPANFFVLSRPGRLFKYQTSPQWQSEILLDLSAEVASIDNEMGAYSFVLHPDFATVGSENAGLAYVYFTHVGEDGQFNRLSRFDLTAPSQQERHASRQDLMNLKRRPSGMHNGGGLFFGADGFLYLSLGDFGGRKGTKDGVQTINRLLTSGIFRIDVNKQGGEISGPIKRQPENGVTGNYYVPLDNPWYETENALGEFWALGLRNPWRISQDPDDGSIWLGDVGRDQVEEIDRLEMGDNAQWNYREGPLEVEPKLPENLIGNERPPVYWYKQTALARAVMGGQVYTGQNFPNLKGKYLFGDNQAATIYSLDRSDPANTVQIVANAQKYGQLGMTGIYADENGEIFITLLGGKDEPSGEIVRLISADETAVAKAQVGSPSEGSAELEASVNEKYLSVCSRCHGEDGKGDPEFDLGVERPDFTTAEWQNSMTDEYLSDVIIKGGEAVGKSDVMPAWEEFFSDAEMVVLIKKLRNFAEQ